MTDFQHIVTFPAIAQCDGLERMLTAKVVCELVVFAGGEHGATSIPATAPLSDINHAWVTYCQHNNATEQANPLVIDQGDLDRARGIF